MPDQPAPHPSAAASEAGRQLAAQRRSQPVECAACGRIVQRLPRVNEPRYCSPACKMRAYRQRRRQREQTAQEPHAAP